MATSKLTAADVRKMRTPGRYGDGGGLWLVVVAPERRHFALRYTWQGKTREMTLGSAEHVSLATARQHAADARRLVDAGRDPLAERRPAAEPVAAAVVTFAAVAEAYIAINEAGWRNPKHRQQWRNTLTAYVYPEIGASAVPDIDAMAVMRVLEPIWTTKNETAVRIRGRIEKVSDFARVKGWREGPNPAAWRGNLQFGLPARAKAQAVGHHAALDWRDTPSFMVALRGREGVGALALEFAILTAARSGEVRGATGDRYRPRPVDDPGSPHEGAKGTPGPAVPCRPNGAANGPRVRDRGTHISGTATRSALVRHESDGGAARMGRGELTAHGFRSSFRDWAAETGHPNDIAEAALAHTLSSKTVVAYQRGDLLERRKTLMDTWAEFCGSCAATSMADTGDSR
jgi:integrase